VGGVGQFLVGCWTVHCPVIALTEAANGHQHLRKGQARSLKGPLLAGRLTRGAAVAQGAGARIRVIRSINLKLSGTAAAVVC
jgi:hypothetical protein